MTITQLEYVIAVAEHQNFTLAAQKCNVTQPTLSMQIQKLEDELGIKIFDRSKKSVLLTEVGAEIVQQAKNVLGESERIFDIVDQQKGFIGGAFKLGVIPTITPTLVPMFLKIFNNKYPNIFAKNAINLTTPFYVNGSYPPLEKGLHFNILLPPYIQPFITPYFSMACFVYSEQVG